MRDVLVIKGNATFTARTGIEKSLLERQPDVNIKVWNDFQPKIGDYSTIENIKDALSTGGLNAIYLGIRQGDYKFIGTGTRRACSFALEQGVPVYTFEARNGGIYIQSMLTADERLSSFVISRLPWIPDEGCDTDIDKTKIVTTIDGSPTAIDKEEPVALQQWPVGLDYFDSLDAINKILENDQNDIWLII